MGYKRAKPAGRCGRDGRLGAARTVRDVAGHGHTVLAAGMGKGEWDEELSGTDTRRREGAAVDEEAEEGQTSDMSGSSFPKNPTFPK